MKPFATLLTIHVAAVLLLPVPSLGSVDEVSEEKAPPRSHTARIFENGVQPEVVELRVGDEIGWLNYSGQRAQVSFESEVAKSLVCKTEGAFRLDGHRLISYDIQARQFASLCSLKPGVYEYEVELRPGIGATGSITKRVLTGKIVVSK